MKLIKKLINISLIMIMCLGCFSLVACDNKSNNDTPDTPPLALNQVTIVCNSIFGDLGRLPHSVHNTGNINANTEEQTSPTGIDYSEYTSYIASNTYDNFVTLVNKIEFKYELFKANLLELSHTYEYKVANDDYETQYYMYLRISSVSSSKIKVEWAETKEQISATYNDEFLYRSIIVDLDSNLTWKTIEVKEFNQQNYGSTEANANYYYIEKSSSTDMVHDRYTFASTDYKYVDVNTALNKSIVLDCSHPSVLTKNQIKAKAYINSLNLTNMENIEIFKYDAEFRGIFMIDDV